MPILPEKSMHTISPVHPAGLQSACQREESPSLQAGITLPAQRPVKSGFRDDTRRCHPAEKIVCDFLLNR
jgi:hypothetical protein